MELTHDEALSFIGKKVKYLEEKTKQLTYDTTKIKANIKIVLHGLREVQNISEETPETSKNRDLLFG